MGVFQLIAYYVSSIVGVGILTIPVVSYKVAGDYSLIAWILLMILSIPFASLFAFISIKKPHASGVGEFIKHVLGKKFSQPIVYLMIITMVIGNPVMGITSARYLQNIINFDNRYLILFAYGFMILSILFNTLGIKTSARLQTFLLYFLISSLSGLIFISLPHINVNSIHLFDIYSNTNKIGRAMVIGFFSFLGWENVCSLADNIKNPKKTFTISVIISIVIIGFLYIGISFSYVGLQGNNHINDTLVKVILNKTFKNIDILGNILALVLMIVATNAWVLGASKLIGSLKYKKSHNYNLGILAFLYGLVFSTIFLINGSEDVLIKIANMNFFIVYLLSFISIFKFTQLIDNRNKIINLLSMLGILSILVMGCFIEYYIIVLSVLLYISCLILNARLSKSA